MTLSEIYSREVDRINRENKELKYLIKESINNFGINDRNVRINKSKLKVNQEYLKIINNEFKKINNNK